MNDGEAADRFDALSPKDKRAAIAILSFLRSEEYFTVQEALVYLESYFPRLRIEALANLRDVLDHLVRAAQQDADDGRVLHHLSEAEEHLRRSLTYSPGNSASLYFLAELLIATLNNVGFVWRGSPALTELEQAQWIGTAVNGGGRVREDQNRVSRPTALLDANGRYQVSCVPGKYKVTLAPIPVQAGGGNPAGGGDGKVSTLPLGGSITVLASGQGDPHDIAVDGTSAYWVNYGDGAVRKISIAGGSVKTLASSQSAPAGIAVDTTNVYWTNFSGGTVMKVPVDGGSATTLASGTPPRFAVGVEVSATETRRSSGPGARSRRASAASPPTRRSHAQPSCRRTRSLRPWASHARPSRCTSRSARTATPSWAT